MQTKIITLVFSLFIASTSFAQTATLKMRFVFDGVPPVAKSMNVGAAFPLIANGRFEPRITVARAGDSLELVQRGAIRYNPSVNFLMNPNFSGMIQPGGPPSLEMPKA